MRNPTPLILFLPNLASSLERYIIGWRIQVIFKAFDKYSLFVILRPPMAMLKILAHIFIWNHYSSLFPHKRFYQSIKICIKFSVRRWQQSKRGQTWEWSKFLSHSLFQLRMISFSYHRQSICFQRLPTYGHSLDSTFFLPIANINLDIYALDILPYFPTTPHVS